MKRIMIYSVVLVLFFALGYLFAGGTTNFDKIALGGTPEITLSNSETIANGTDGIIAMTGAATVSGSLAVGQTNQFIKKIGRTSYGDSLYIVVYAKNTGKDTVFLALE